MAEINLDILDCKKEKTKTDECASGVFKPLPFQNILQGEKVCVNSSVKLERVVMDDYKKEENVQTLAEDDCESKEAIGTLRERQDVDKPEESRMYPETHTSPRPRAKRRCPSSGMPSEKLEPTPSCSSEGADSLDVRLACHGEDEYDHVEDGLVYVTTSFPGAGISDSVYDYCIRGCACVGLCSEGCGCSLQYGCPYESGKLKEHHYGKPIFECNDWCVCESNCPNRVVQRGPVTGLRVLALQGKGYGVISSSFIPRNSFVCEYAGEYVGLAEARARFSRQRGECSNYILVLREHVQGTASGPYVTVIDPTVVGNIGRYINHSCDPNLIVVPVRTNGTLPLAALFAVRDISPGEELCYDYSNTVLAEENATPSAVVKTNMAGLFEGLLDCQLQNTEVDDATLVNTSGVGVGTLNASGGGVGTLSASGGGVVKVSTSESGVGMVNTTGDGVCMRHEVNTILPEESHVVVGCEMSGVLSSDVIRTVGPSVDSASHIRKPCLCKSKNCRKFLPADKDII